MTKRLLPLIVLGITVCIAAVSINQVDSYPMYNGTPACDDCHSGFVGGFGAPLHDLHNLMTSSCTNCHNAIGDNPPLEKCAGCHVSGENGGGLVLHHTNAGAPADLNGLFCATCHPNAATNPENVLPPYYGTANVSLSDPCELDTAVGGEDYDGDGFGLDNDGDLLYDMNDPDCETVPVERSTWGAIKAVYQ